jgi:hypothetical protein
MEKFRQAGESVDVVTTKKIVQTWWPLAASWIFMALELPALSIIIARMPDPAINLAAWGGIVFPVALIIEAPIIMLLAASTALSKDYASYLKLKRFMIAAGAALTLLHIAIAFTPLYDLLVVGLMQPPSEIVEGGRLGLQLFVPWTWAIAYRRFNQGALIRFGHSNAIGAGTAVRLGTDIVVLIAGFLIGNISGIALAAVAVSCGVLAEAGYTFLRIRPILRNEIRSAPDAEISLTRRSFLAFYTPLAATSFLTLLIQPMGSAALSRMPQALESLAVWPALSGIVFLFRSFGVAYNEVVVALLDTPGSVKNLRRFMIALSIVTTLMLMIVAATPLSNLWFETISGLPVELARLGQAALWFTLPAPVFGALQSWLQGAMVNRRQTSGITEAVVVFLVSATAGLWAGVIWGRTSGLIVGWLAFNFGFFTQTLWLLYRSRPSLKILVARDQEAAKVI